MKKRIVNFVKFILKKEKAILVIFTLGLFLRLLGTYPGYPLTHPDEPTIATPAIRIAFEGNFRPQNYYYGSLLSLIYAVTYIVFFIPLSFIFTLPTNFNYLNNGILGYFQYLQKGPPLHQMSFWSASYWARYDSAIISSFTVLAVYLLGRKLFNREIALIAALLVAVNYRHVLSSRLILADAPAALFALLSVLSCVNFLKKSSLKNYLLAGVALGTTLSVKYFVYVIPTFLLCHFLSCWEATKFNIYRLIAKFLHYKLFLAVFICVAVFILVNPYLLLAHDEASYYWAANSARYGLRLSIDILKSWNISYYSLYYLFYYGLGPIISILTIIGFPLSIIRYPKSTLILTSTALPFIYIFLIVSGTGMVRNYAAIIPFVLFFPAVLIYNACKLSSKLLPSLKLAFMIGLLSFASYQMANYSLASGWYLTKEQNMIALYNWMEAHIPDGSKILAPSGVFYPTGKNFEGIRINTNGNNLLSMEEAQKQQTRWLILNSIPAEITENLLLTSKIAQQSFRNRDLPGTLTSNFYNTLVFNELSDYRVAEFAKPLTQDPPFMVITFPSFWKIAKDNKVVEFNFDKEDSLEGWRESYFPIRSFDYSLTTTGKTLLIKQTSPQCKSLYTKITSPKISINPNSWYTLAAQAKRNSNSAYKTTRNGFFRLDFYTKNDQLLKTYVTQPLSANNSIQELNAAGMAPENTKYTTISFNLDSCLDQEEYLINQISLFWAKEAPKIDKNKYPFYMNKAILFDWLPQL